jgi:hypothetical protein
MDKQRLRAICVTALLTCSIVGLTGTASSTPVPPSPYNIPDARHDPQQNIGIVQYNDSTGWHSFCTAWLYGTRQYNGTLYAYFGTAGHCVYGHSTSQYYYTPTLEWPTMRVILHYNAPSYGQQVCTLNWKHVASGFPISFMDVWSSYAPWVATKDYGVFAGNCGPVGWPVYPVVSQGNPSGQSYFATGYPVTYSGMTEDHDVITLQSDGWATPGDGTWWETDHYGIPRESGSPDFKYVGNVGGGFSTYGVAGLIGGGHANAPPNDRHTLVKWFCCNDIAELAFWRDQLNPTTGT